MSTKQDDLSVHAKEMQADWFVQHHKQWFTWSNDFQILQQVSCSKPNSVGLDLALEVTQTVSLVFSIPRVEVSFLLLFLKESTI